MGQLGFFPRIRKNERGGGGECDWHGHQSLLLCEVSRVPAVWVAVFRVLSQGSSAVFTIQVIALLRMMHS
jgi:hypothetical protein